MAANEKGQVTYKTRPIKITPDFSLETLKARRFWIDILQILRATKWKPTLLYPVKLSIIIDGETRYSMNKQDFHIYIDR